MTVATRIHGIIRRRNFISHYRNRSELVEQHGLSFQDYCASNCSALNYSALDHNAPNLLHDAWTLNSESKE